MVTVIENLFDNADVHHVISLGAGVQSTVLYLMAALGELEPKPEAAIFADTQWEPVHVYRHLDWLQSLELDIPIVRVSAGNLYANTWDGSRLDTGRKYPFTDIPAYSKRDDGTEGIGRRQCTREFQDRADPTPGAGNHRPTAPRSGRPSALHGAVDGDKHRRMDALQRFAGAVDTKCLPANRGRHEPVGLRRLVSTALSRATPRQVELHRLSVPFKPRMVAALPRGPRRHGADRRPRRTPARPGPRGN